MTGFILDLPIGTLYVFDSVLIGHFSSTSMKLVLKSVMNVRLVLCRSW